MISKNIAIAGVFLIPNVPESFHPKLYAQDFWELN